MKTENSALLPRQDRSRATVERLLNATIGLLDQSGLEAASIPRIAAAAEMAPGNVYRRFADKNALLRAAFLHALEQSNASNRGVLASQLAGDVLETSARKLMVLLVEQYRRHPHFLRALSRFIEGDSDQEFVQAARALIGANIDLVVDALLAHRLEIRHAQPGSALRFAVLSATCSIEAYALDDYSIWHLDPAIPIQELTEGLVHGFVTYLTSAPRNKA